MIQLRKTLEIAQNLLQRSKIDFALIGGFALGAHGIHRATKDIDLLVDGSQKEKVRELFTSKGFRVFNESKEVLQLDGIGYVDIVFANRPLSLEIIQKANFDKLRLAGVPVVSREAIIGLKIQAFKNDPQRVLQDKADIKLLLNQSGVNLVEVKKYADLFDAWSEIEELLK